MVVIEKTPEYPDAAWLKSNNIIACFELYKSQVGAETELPNTFEEDLIKLIYSHPEKHDRWPSGAYSYVAGADRFLRLGEIKDLIHEHLMLWLWVGLSPYTVGRFIDRAVSHVRAIAEYKHAADHNMIFYRIKRLNNADSEKVKRFLSLLGEDFYDATWKFVNNDFSINVQNPSTELKSEFDKLKVELNGY